MVLEVLAGGLQTTVQDRGRPGFGHLGVPHGGAADPWSLAAANALIGNHPGAAALELTLVGPELRVIEPVVLSVAGADLGGVALFADDRGEQPLRPGRSYRLEAGTVLSFPGAPGGESGIRSYLGLAGGVDVPVVLGSRSTALAAGFGGLDGRSLEPGDQLRPALPGSSRHQAVWPATAVHPLVEARLADPAFRVRVVPGPGVTPGDRDFAVLIARDWRIRPDSDRMGLRLEGDPLASGSGDAITAPTTWGAVQVPADGQPIVLLADHQPTGGYPVIAVAIAADRPVLGQLGPGATIRFEAVEEPSARELLAVQRRAIDAAAECLGDDARWDDLWQGAGG